MRNRLNKNRFLNDNRCQKNIGLLSMIFCFAFSGIVENMLWSNGITGLGKYHGNPGTGRTDGLRIQSACGGDELVVCQLHRKRTAKPKIQS